MSKIATKGAVLDDLLLSESARQHASDSVDDSDIKDTEGFDDGGDDNDANASSYTGAIPKERKLYPHQSEPGGSQSAKKVTQGPAARRNYLSGCAMQVVDS